MFERFFLPATKYQNVNVNIELDFKSPLMPKRRLSHTLLKTQEDLERKLHDQNKKTMLSPQRTSEVADALFDSFKFSKSPVLHAARESLSNAGKRQHSNGYSRDYFAGIYCSNSEVICEQFKGLPSLHLERLKADLYTALADFLSSLDKRFNPVASSLKERNKLDECKQVIRQTMNMVISAKTMSALISSLVVEADLLAQMEVMGSLVKGNYKNRFMDTVSTTVQGTLFTSPGKLFKTDLPQVIRECPISLGNKLHTSGSAFQLEQLRESLIIKLEKYLESRARYRGTELNPADKGYLKTSYQPIDRGFFYNKPLQNAHIKVAARLLMQLERMQLEDGTPIDNPQAFANALNEARDGNKNNINLFARPIDGLGHLYNLLESTRMEMDKAYEGQNIRIGRHMNLRQQLGFEDRPAPSINS